MTNGRQIELRSGSTTLALNDATYILQADGGWASQDERLAFKVLLKTTTLAQLERLITPVERLLTAAELYDQALIGSPVYVVTKSCDELSTTAEFGATWLRKRVTGGRVRVVSVAGVAASPQAYLLIELTVDALWRRITPAPIVEVTSGSATGRTADGAITTAGATTLEVRRTVWTASTGVSVRAFWEYASAGSGQVDFFRASSNMRCYWGGTAARFYVIDDAGTAAQSGIYSFTAGQVIEVVAVISAGVLLLYVNGVQAVKAGGSYSLTAPDTYKVFETNGAAGAQTLLSSQVWPTALSEAQCAALASRGRPEPELVFTTPPADNKMTNALYKIYNVPGHAPALLRLLLNSSGGQDFSQVRAGVRPSRVPPAVTWECESGTLGTATAANANASASAGSQARFTPADTSWATRTTLAIAANPATVEALQGNHRLFLAGYDSASAVNVNLLRWRVVVAGQAGAWSDEFGFGAVATRSLLDLGELSIPTDGWPEESLTATTTGYGSTYITLEIQAKNTVGSGGGTLDLDALYLAPGEIEGVATATFDVSDVNLLLDFATEPPTAVTIRSPLSLEYAGPGTWRGSDLSIAPAGGAAGGVWAAWYRNGSEELYPNDLCDVRIYLAPRWRSS